MSFRILHRGSRISLANTATEGWDPTETTLGGSVSSGSSMTSRTAARLAWGIAILSYAIVAACLVLLWLERATIGSVGAGPLGDVVPPATPRGPGAPLPSRPPANPLRGALLFLPPPLGVSGLAPPLSIPP